MTVPETVPEPSAVGVAPLADAASEGASLDRAAEWRDDPQTLPRLRADPRTRVLVVRERRVPLGDGLILVPADDAVLARTREWALLGRRPDGSGLLLALQEPEDDTDADGSWAPRWSDLREALPLVDAADGELVVAAIALAGWLRDAGFCPACGSPAELRQSGWSRHCGSCGREHFPAPTRPSSSPCRAPTASGSCSGPTRSGRAASTPASPASSRRGGAGDHRAPRAVRRGGGARA